MFYRGIKPIPSTTTKTHWTAPAEAVARNVATKEDFTNGARIEESMQPWPQPPREPHTPAAPPAPASRALAPSGTLETVRKCYRMPPWGDVCLYNNACFTGTAWYFFEEDAPKIIREQRIWAGGCGRWQP